MKHYNFFTALSEAIAFTFKYVYKTSLISFLINGRELKAGKPYCKLLNYLT